jgi:hypothetical protein
LRLNEQIAGVYGRLEELELESVLRRSTNRGGIDFEIGGTRRFLFLRPIVNGTILPLLNLSASLYEEPTSMRARLGLFMFDSSKKLAGLGFRFESSEGPGQHAYSHVQVIRSLDKDGGRIFPQASTWFPTSYPAFPLSATDPVSIVLAMLLSIYGLEDLEQQIYSQQFWPFLRDQMKNVLNGCGGHYPGA